MIGGKVCLNVCFGIFDNVFPACKHIDHRHNLPICCPGCFFRSLFRFATLTHIMRVEMRTSTMENWATSHTPQPFPCTCSRCAATALQATPETRIKGTTTMNTTLSLFMLKFLLFSDTRRTTVMKSSPRRAEKAIAWRPMVQGMSLLLL